MREVGLFPLGVVLFPGERLPLHIFEPRYRELIGECLDEDREFGLVFADEEGVRDVGTLAAVVEVIHRFPDGRLNIIVKGREAFRLLRSTGGRSFQTGEIEVLSDDPDPAEPGAVQRALHMFGRLAEQAGAEVEQPPQPGPLLSYELASQIDYGPDVKQNLLEMRSERERLRRVVDLLERSVHVIAIEREVQERAARNGKVFTPKE